jgi:oligoribonuclease
MEKIIWVDIETTGLDYEKDSILEIAVLVTNYDLKVLDIYQKEVKPPQGYVISSWAEKTHTENNLLKNLEHKPTIEQVDQELVEWAIETIVIKDKYPIAGNSIYFDKRFVESRLPLFNQYIGKSVIDVSGISKLLSNLRMVNKENVIKTYQHRAMPDILESIDELRHYIRSIR